MLRRIRVILGIIFFTLITLLFLDFTGVVHKWFGWMAKAQLIPAILAHNLVIILILVLLTVLFGRIYCSVICPLGVMQDGVSRASRTLAKRRYCYSPAISWLRYVALALFVVGLAAGISAVVSILDPYSAYGRIAGNLFAPLYRWGNNLLAFIAGRLDSYTFYPVEVWLKGGITLAVAAVTLLVVGYLAWRGGRTWCNTVCPVGTLLGFISRHSIFKPVIDPAKCTRCSQCSRACKASCIDYKNFRIDHSRCVTCMNCLDKCKFDAIHYTSRKQAKKVAPAVTASKASVQATTDASISRRGFLAIGSMMAVSAAVKAQQPVIDGGLAFIEDKKAPERKVPVLPPGAISEHHLKRHCSACQLCVSACPNNILRPSNSLSRFMQPEMSFERGYCRPECTRCSEVCPNKAITRIDTAEKSATKIGTAYWIRENCIVNTDDVTCTACERHCPTGAIQLVPREAGDPGSLRIPVVCRERCIGCGACENLCPARPLSAIYVEGVERQRTI